MRRDFSEFGIQRLEARRALAVDLMIEASDDFEPQTNYVPGDNVLVPFEVRNNGAESFTGRFTVTVTARRDDGFGTYEPEGPEILVSGVLSGLQPDASTSFVASIPVTAEYRPGDYVFDAVLVPKTSAGFEIEDEYWGNNGVSTEPEGPVEFLWRFGSFDGRENVEIELIDRDGTRFAIALGGFGYGDIDLVGGTVTDPVFDVLVTTTSPIPVTMAFKVLGPARPGADDLIDFRGDIAFESDSADYDPLVRNFNGPRLNFEGVATLPSRSPVLSDAIKAILSTSQELQDLWDELVPLGGGNAKFRDIKGEVTFDGELNTVAARDLTDAAILFDGEVGVVQVRHVTSSLIEGSADIEFFRAGLITDSELYFELKISEFEAQSLTRSDLQINWGGLPMRTRIDLEIDQIANSSVFIDMKVDTLGVGRWIDAAGSPRGSLTARAINLLVTDVATPQNPTAGRWDADVFVIGGIGRRTQLGEVSIGGTLSGSFFVGGSVGVFNAATVQNGSYNSQVAGKGYFAPTLAALGTVTLFETGNLKSGALWAGHAKNVRATVQSNFAWFELAGGARLDRQALVNGDVNEALESVRWASGVIGTYRATINPGVTGFISRAVSGVDLTTDDATIQRVPSRQGALALSTGYELMLPDTTSRIAAIQFTGSVAGSSLQFAFMEYPPGWFTLGTGGLNVLIPAAPSNGPGVVQDIFPAPNARASIFFRAARPV